MTETSINIGGIAGKPLYIVQMRCMEERKGFLYMSWQTVDSTPYQNQAMDLEYFIRNESFTSVKQVYKSEYYKEWSEKQMNLKRALRK